MEKADFNMIQLLRMIDKVETESWDGTREQAERWADKFTDMYGIKAFVIHRQDKYEWVTKWFFESYDYDGKIYYETEVEDE